MSDEEIRFCTESNPSGMFVRILLLLFACLFALAPESAAQHPVQTIRGTVSAEDTRIPLPGATVRLAETDPLIGTATDAQGRFRIENVPVGRYDIIVSFIGYEPRIVREVLLTAGREVVLEISLRESVMVSDEVVVTAGTAITEAIDPMAVASVRLLSIEQTSRYAGALDDPARLVGTMAGVAGALGDNAVVIRGNAPKGVLWRMDGVEIPAPTHFANLVTFGGGGMTALSTRMLSDSDFFLGAFPAEYGGALSGVFDMRIRTGNSERHEHAVKAGVIGIDVSSEGPIAADYGGSYIANYRYSTFGLLGPLLPEDADAIRFQNLAFKLNLPTSRLGSFSIFGIGGADRSGQKPVENPAEWVYDDDREDVESPTRFGALSLQHRAFLGTTGMIESSLTATGSSLRWDVGRLTSTNELRPYEYVSNEEGRVSAASTINLRVARGHTNRTGVVVSRLGFAQDIRHVVGDGMPDQIVDEAGKASHVQAFSQSRIDRGRLSFTAGAHLQHVGLSGETTLEPRAGVQWNLGERQSLSLAYGLHAQREVLSLYFAHAENRDLRMTKAHHIIGGYSATLGDRLTLLLEAYHQHLYDVPVVDGTSFSTLNLDLDWFVQDRLVNEGLGRNTGIEMTLERGLADGWYGVLTSSLFSSRYRGGDGRRRPTRFDRRTVTTLLMGKEWTFSGERTTRQLSLNGRANVMGGRRYSPVDEAASLDAREVVYNERDAFSLREPLVVYGDATAEYRINYSRSALIVSMQFLNVTGHSEFYGHRFNLRENRVDEEREAIVIPNLSVTFQW